MNVISASVAPARVAARSPVRERYVPTIEEAFREHAGLVHNYLRAAGIADSEDTLSEVFIDVMRGLGRFRGDGDALRRWIFTIAHHRVVDEHRRTTRRRRMLRSIPTEGSITNGDPVDPALIAALDTLTPDQREVVVLRFVADLSVENVAALTKRPPGAVKSLQHRALRNLAAQLAPGSAVRDTDRNRRPRADVNAVAGLQ